MPGTAALFVEHADPDAAPHPETAKPTATTSSTSGVKVLAVFPDGSRHALAVEPAAPVTALYAAVAAAAGIDAAALAPPTFLQLVPGVRLPAVDDPAATASLASVGVKGASATVRVISPGGMAAGGGGGDASAAGESAGGGGGGGIMGIVKGAAGWAGSLFGRGSGGAPTAAAPPAGAPATERRSMTLHELRAEEARRKEAAGGKTEYFGGDSTAFEKRPDDDKRP